MNRIMLTLLVCLAACAPRSMPSTPVASTPAPSAEQIQQNMMEAGRVRPEHALLRNFVGSWRVETKFWMDPHAAPEVSKGTAQGTLLFGGRFVSMTYKGTAMGQAFAGQGLVGFNNVSNSYFSTWIDSMSTGHMMSEGQAAPDGKSITLSSSFTCPMTRENTHMEDVYTFLDKNRFRYEAFQVKEGQRIKSLELAYTRKK